MSYVLANLAEGQPLYFSIDKNLAGGLGMTCFQTDMSKALHFARKEDADKFAEAYYPFMSLNAKAATA